MNDIKSICREERKRERPGEILIYILKILNAGCILALPVYISGMVQRVLDGSGVGLGSVLGGAAIFCLGAAVLFAGSYVEGNTKKKFSCAVMEAVCTRNMYAKYKEYRKRKQDEDIQAVINQSGEIAGYYFNTLPELLISVIVMIGCLAGAVLTSQSWSIFILLAAVVCMALSNLISQKVKRYQKESLEIRNTYFAFLVKIMKEIRTVKLFVLYDKVRCSIEKMSSSIVRTCNRVFFLEDLQRRLMETAKYILLGAGLIAFINESTFSAADFVLYEQLIVLLFSYCSSVIALINSINKKRNATDILNDILLPAEENGSRRINRVDNISLKNITFTYEGQKEIFRDFSLELESGTTYLVKAPNGYGKSTFFQLLLGIETPEAGEIRINGEALSDIDMCQFRRNQVCTLFQSEYFAEDSLEGNLDNYLDDTAPDDIAGYLEELELPVEDKSGDFNSIFSGGQRKKLALAILMRKVEMADRPLVLMDEPTNMLDAETIQKVIMYIQRIKKDAFVIIVSHDARLDSAADRIIQLEEYNNV